MTGRVDLQAAEATMDRAFYLDLKKAEQRIAQLERRLAIYEGQDGELEYVAHKIMRSHDEPEACRLLERFAERVRTVRAVNDEDDFRWAEDCAAQIRQSSNGLAMMRAERQIGIAQGLREAANTLLGAIELEKKRRYK